MPIEAVELTGLTTTELYAVYLAIARADHRWRVSTLHGESKLPTAEFRPLSLEQFDARLQAAQAINGDGLLRERLARQASAYGVDVDSELSRLRQAA